MKIKTLSAIGLILLSQSLPVHAFQMATECEKEGVATAPIGAIAHIQTAAEKEHHTLDGLPSELMKPYVAFAQVAVQFQGSATNEAPNLETNRNYYRRWNDLVTAAAALDGNEEDTGNLIFKLTGIRMTSPISTDLLEDELGSKFRELHEAILGNQADILELALEGSYVPPSLAFANTNRLVIRPLVVAESEFQKWTIMPHVLPATLTELTVFGPLNLNTYPQLRWGCAPMLPPAHQKELLLPASLAQASLKGLSIHNTPVDYRLLPFEALAPSLTRLELSANPMKVPLPDSFSGLTGLTGLKLAHNDFREVPSLAGFSNLEWLTIYERCMTEVAGLSSVKGGLLTPWRKLRPDNATWIINQTLTTKGEAAIHFPTLAREHPEELWKHMIV